MDVLMYLFLAAWLIPANIFIIKWHRSGRFPLWAAGILLAVFSIGLGYAARFILVDIGATGQGGAIMAMFIGLVVLANGVIHFVIGMVLTIVKLVANKRARA
ncbi:inner-membrane translocator [Planococcus sp. CP5-4]|uniref:inner-membrane translocator n=1 Tax=unclassified Planococcus (in: firmicutes) TaxID=2662419 RepID=UPI001C232027|nr:MULTISPECIES: inner-membrane translocator [unclassified Planococcus (in: firmicutes)]MBU9671882.1 inner-membrane translocator [Planococcus sp. CP5-4_YE]MBV0909202.1 inner-membrane translocator [Planococcus sp. CP5-4_UN]MBW6063694.1 inner-membrane translocator [Planococcus sp. CP5-4]